MCLTTHTVLPLVSAFVQRNTEKEKSDIPTTIYYPSDFCAVFTTNATLRSVACYFSLRLSGELVFTYTFSSVLVSPLFFCWLAQRTHAS